MVINLTTISHIKKIPREGSVRIRCKINIDDECHFFLHCQIYIFFKIRSQQLNHRT